jgi:hypothetical protein
LSGHPPADVPNDEELRARLEEELRKIKVRDVLLQSVVTLLNLGGQRLGLVDETSDQRDPEQTRLAIEAVRTLLPLLESDPETAPALVALRDALAQLQLAYAREVEGSGGEPTRGPSGPGSGGGDQGGGPPRGDERVQPPQEGPKRPSGGLWVPPGSAT